MHACAAASVPVASYIPPVRKTIPPAVTVPEKPSQPVVRIATYTVRSGDTLSGIARAHCPVYGDWKNLQAFNHITGFLRPGEVITLACG